MTDHLDGPVSKSQNAVRLDLKIRFLALWRAVRPFVECLAFVVVAAFFYRLAVIAFGHDLAEIVTAGNLGAAYFLGDVHRGRQGRGR